MDVDNGTYGQSSSLGLSKAALNLGAERTISILHETLSDYLDRGLPLRRIAKLAGLLCLSKALKLKKATNTKLVLRVLNEQQDDGGWVDCEDTVWCLFIIKQLPHHNDKAIAKAMEWLKKERTNFAWGYCKRDKPCIPITASVHILCSSLRDESSSNWLNKTWSADLTARYCLSYKAAWFLLASDLPNDNPLIHQTINHLISDQRQSGGWGPWKEHSAADNFFSTGITMWALSTRMLTEDSQKALMQALEWCKRMRLPNGFFPGHYIEEESSWVLIGEIFASMALE